jgi:hypothetical protein
MCLLLDLNILRWKENKRAMMALDRSPDPSNSSEQLTRQAFWPSFMTGESKMWPLECLLGLSIVEQWDLVFYPGEPYSNLT